MPTELVELIAAPALSTAPGRLETSLPFQLGRTHRLLRAAWESRIADLRLSGPQASVVRAVADEPGVGLRELARRLRTDPMNAKRIADTLESEGFLASCDDPADRRRRVLGPTEPGRVLAAELERRAREWNGEVESIVGHADTEMLRTILRRIDAAIGALPEPVRTNSGRPSRPLPPTR